MNRIGEGRGAEIFEHSPGLVLKLYFDRFDEAFVRQAARTAGAVADGGVAAPRIHGVERHGDRYGVVMDRIEGGTLFDELISAPDQVEEIGGRLAQLHIAIHELTVDGLKSRSEDLLERVGRAPGVDASVKQLAADSVTGTQDRTLSHGDLHPANVMVSTNGTLLAIDWDFAMMGPPAFDVARAWFLLHHWALAPGDFDRQVIDALREQLADSYLDAYVSNSDIRLGEIEAWMLPASVARLNEPIPEEEARVRADITALTRGSGAVSG